MIDPKLLEKLKDLRTIARQRTQKTLKVIWTKEPSRLVRIETCVKETQRRD
jgi:hypothetical protein